MPIATPKDLFVVMLSDLRHGAERSQIVYKELAEAAQDPEIKEVLDARASITGNILSRLDECFNLIGEKPVPADLKVREEFVENFRKELAEIKAPLVRKLFVLSRAHRLLHLRIAEHEALIAASGMLAHPAVRLHLEAILAEKRAHAEALKRLIAERVREKIAAAA